MKRTYLDKLKIIAIDLSYDLQNIEISISNGVNKELFRYEKEFKKQLLKDISNLLIQYGIGD